MKELVNKLIANFHFAIVLYGLWGAWGLYEQHTVQIEAVEARIPTIEAETESNKKKIKEILEFTKKTEESKIRVEQVAKNIEEAQRQLPSEISDSQIIFFINQEMASLNIKEPTIAPGSEVTGTYYITKDYNVKARGTFLQMLIFLEKVGNAARIFNIKNLKLVADDSGKKGRFQLVSGDISIEAFRMNPNFKVDLEFKEEK